MSTANILGWADDPSGLLLVYDGDGSVVTVARPGSGKSRCVAIPNLIQYRGSMVVNDIKGELAEATALWRAMMLMMRIVTFDPFKVVRPKFIPKGMHGEPCYGSIDLIAFVKRSSSPLSAAFQIGEALIVQEGTSDAHWSDAARNLLVALILFVAYETPEETQNMAQVWDIFTNSELFAGTIRMMLDSDITHVRDQAAAYSNVSDDNREIASIKNNLRTQCTRTFSEPTIMDMISGPDSVDFSRINSELMTVYIVIPASLIEVHFRFVRLIINVILAEIERGGLRSYE